MAHPILVKLAATAATDKRVQKFVGVIIAAAMFPIFLVIAVFMKFGRDSAEYNKTAIDYLFAEESDAQIFPHNCSETQQMFLLSAREKLKELCAEINNTETGLNQTEVKALFVCVYGQLLEAEKEISCTEFIGFFLKTKQIKRGDEYVFVTVYNDNLNEIIGKILATYPELNTDIDYAGSVREIQKYMERMGY